MRFLTDFRELNKYMKREEWPKERMPINLIKGYYTLCLSKQARQLYQIILPLGIYRYKCLSQGIKIVADTF